MTTWDGDDWGEIVRTAHGLYIKVWVDYDELTASQARELAGWLLKKATNLEGLRGAGPG